MKNKAKLFIFALAASILVACGKETPAKVAADNEVTAANEAEAETRKETAEPDSQRTEVQSMEPETETNVEAVTVEVLGKAYADYLEKVAGECYTPEELAFATADVNNDGTRELLYAESSVNAAGVFVCFYNDGNVVPTGPFGCYGGIKYVPSEGKIISVMENYDYMQYELFSIDEKFEPAKEHTYATEPDSDGEGYVFFFDDEEVTMDAYVNAFAKLQSMDVRSLDYFDMYLYEMAASDSVEEQIKKSFAEEPSRASRIIIPMVEKEKLIGTWEMYSSEIEGEVSYAKDGNVSGVITVHEDYTVDLDYGRHKMNGMWMDFYHGAFNDYADNTDWYVVIWAYEEDGTTIYMNVSEDDQLVVNTISEGETLVSLWDVYNRVK